MVLKKLIKTDTDLGLLLIRLTFGLLFIWGGVGKLFGILGGPGLVGFSGMVWGSMALAVIVAVVELVAGVGLILGMWVRESAFALAIITLFAMGMIWIPAVIANGPGNMALLNVLIHLSLVGSLVALIFTGSGKKALAEN